MVLLSLDDPAATNPARVGGKAAVLAALRQAGFPVPEGVVLTLAAFDATGALTDAARAALDDARLGLGPVAVRSSAVGEDGEQASFAGLFETVLDVRGRAAVEAAITRCRASAQGARVAAYQAGVPEMAVLIQRFLVADAAGVAFTANPVTGDREERVLSAVAGGGAAMLGGEADAEEWAVRDAATCRRRRGVLTATEAEAIAALAVRVAATRGAPQDIEWAKVDGQLFLLQARPITALPAPVRWEVPFGCWSRHLRLGEWLGEPVTPLFESWLLDRIERGMYRIHHDWMGVAIPDPTRRIVNGWYFGRLDVFPTHPLSILKGMGLWLWKMLVQPRRAVMATPLTAAFGAEHAAHTWRTDISPRHQAAVARAAQQVEQAPIPTLPALIDHLADHTAEVFAALTLAGGLGWKFELPFAAFWRKHLAEHGAYQQLLQGLTPPTLAAHAVTCLDWMHPTIGESAQHPLPSPRSDLAAARQQLEATCQAALSGRARAQFVRLLTRAQRFAVIREEQASELTRAWPVLRRAIQRIAAALVAQGALQRPEQVWFLSRAELDVALGGGPAPDGLTERRATWERQRRFAPPLVVGTPPAMFKWFFAYLEQLRSAPPATDALLVGLPASAGRATGPARIVRSPADFERVRPGDILVCPVTTPAWTPLFATVAAVVTDTGSPLAHASLIAREFGIPAVVGTTNGTLRISDGHVVTVDGGAGVVRGGRSLG